MDGQAGSGQAGSDDNAERSGGWQCAQSCRGTAQHGLRTHAHVTEHGLRTHAHVTVSQSSCHNAVGGPSTRYVACVATAELALLISDIVRSLISLKAPGTEYGSGQTPHSLSAHCSTASVWLEAKPRMQPWSLSIAHQVAYRHTSCVSLGCCSGARCPAGTHRQAHTRCEPGPNAQAEASLALRPAFSLQSVQPPIASQRRNPGYSL